MQQQQAIWQAEAAAMAFERAPRAAAVRMAQLSLPSPPPFVPANLGHWRVTAPGVVASTRSADAGILNDRSLYVLDHVRSYEGFCVAESIADRRVARAIAGLPRLAQAADEVVRAAFYREARAADCAASMALVSLRMALHAAFPDLRSPQTRSPDNDQNRQQ